MQLSDDFEICKLIVAEVCHSRDSLQHVALKRFESYCQPQSGTSWIVRMKLVASADEANGGACLPPRST